MSVLRRGLVFIAGTIGNAILFLVYSRGVLEVLSIAEQFPDGPATDALNLLPPAMQLAIGAIQIILIVYLVGGLQDQRTVQRRPQ